MDVQSDDVDTLTRLHFFTHDHELRVCAFQQKCSVDLIVVRDADAIHARGLREHAEGEAEQHGAGHERQRKLGRLSVRERLERVLSAALERFALTLGDGVTLTDLAAYRSWNRSHRSADSGRLHGRHDDRRCRRLALEVEVREAARLTGGRPYLVEVSHFGSEWLWLTPAADALDNVLTDQGYNVEVSVSGINTDPWDFILTPGS